MTGANKESKEVETKVHVGGAEMVTSQRGSKVPQPACVRPMKVKILPFPLSEREPRESF